MNMQELTDQINKENEQPADSDIPVIYAPVTAEQLERVARLVREETVNDCVVMVRSLL